MFNCHCGNFCLHYCHLEKDISRSDILIRIIFCLQASVFLSLFGSVAVKPAKLLIDFLDRRNEIPDVLLLTWAGCIHCYFIDINHTPPPHFSATQTEFSCIIWWRDIFKTLMSSANIVCMQTIWKLRTERDPFKAINIFTTHVLASEDFRGKTLTPF